MLSARFPTVGEVTGDDVRKGTIAEAGPSSALVSLKSSPTSSPVEFKPFFGAMVGLGAAGVGSDVLAMVGLGAAGVGSDVLRAVDGAIRTSAGVGSTVLSSAIAVVGDARFVGAAAGNGFDSSSSDAFEVGSILILAAVGAEVG
jgi:hypothetical protein